MIEKRPLEQTWNLSYPVGDTGQLWPDEVVPMVDFARRFFTRSAPVLDLPCGDGKNTVALSDIGTVIAADSSERALTICERRKRQSHQSSIVTMQADVHDTQFADGTFDNIFCCDLLGHLPAPEAALRELKRILSPSGHIIATFFSENDSVLQDPEMRRNGDGTYWFKGRWFFRFYSEAGVREICSRIGFHVQAIQEFSWVEGPHPGYREYTHQHSSWTAALRRPS